jgi:hypothetical protein
VSEESVRESTSSTFSRVEGDGEIFQHPVGGALCLRAVHMIGEAELGEGSEELATPEPIVLLLVVERDQYVVTEAKTLQ